MGTNGMHLSRKHGLILCLGEPLEDLRMLRALIVAIACFTPLAAVAQSSGRGTPLPDSAIRALLSAQAADWNRGDLDAFAKGYKNSPDILFIGKTVEHGYAAMLAGYRAHYANRAAMGTLSFSDLAVQPLDAHFATATGHFHLQRMPAGGGNADGYFLLVLENTDAGWKIVRDDTTSLPATKQ